MLDLTSPGAYCRAPGGNLEHPELHAPVVKWMAWSINPDGGQPEQWEIAKNKWAQAGIQYFPWLHCHTYGDIKHLIGVANQEAAPAIGMNIEDVVTDKLNLQAVATLLTEWPKPVHMATLAWVQNGQGWSALDRCVAALEIFPDENTDSQHPEQCISHALSEGLTRVTLMLKTKNHTPADYANVFNICHSLYTADDIPATADGWNTWKQSAPCVRIRPDVLTPTQKKRFRAELADYCETAERYEQRWHYSQRRPYGGLGAAPQTWHTDDCSSYVALAFYWAMHHTETLVSDPLGLKYSGYGNTGTSLAYLKAHKAPPGKYLVGDVAIYGTPSNTVHMTVCRVAGNDNTSIWSSHGSEGGPDPRHLRYHPSGLVGVYRHPALL